MKILHTVKSYSPLSGGMYEVVKQISKNLARKGHDVTIASSRCPDNYNDDIKIELFDFSKSGEEKRYQDYLINSDFEIITNFAATQPMTDWALPILDKIKSKKIFVPTSFGGIVSKIHEKYFLQMKTWIKNYDLLIFLSDDYLDINFARENAVPENRMVIIPNGASKEEFFDKESTLNIRKKLGISKDDFLILHVGSFTGVKGHKETIEIFSQAKISDSSLILIGNGDTKSFREIKKRSARLNDTRSFRERNKKIIIPNLNRQETVSAYKESNLFLFPSNTECSPIVLFEAMAAGLPFLTADVGNAKEIIQWSNAGIILPTRHDVVLGNNFLQKFKSLVKKYLTKAGFVKKGPGVMYSTVDIKESAKILEKMFADDKKREALGENGRKSWLDNFTWEKIADEYEREYRKLLEN